MAKTELFAEWLGGNILAITNQAFTTGRHFFVNSATGTVLSGAGLSPDRPITTINGAIALCTAGRGDKIWVMPGHAETIAGAAGVSMTKSDVSIIGLGQGDNRPTLTFSAAASDINVSAENCLIQNLKLVSSVNNLANFIDADAGNLTVRGVTMVTSSLKEAYAFVDIATTKDDFLFEDCVFLQPTDPEGTNAAAGTGAIHCVDTERITIRRCHFEGQFETAIVHNLTTKVQQLVIEDSYLHQLLVADGKLLILVAASSGIIKGSVGVNEGGATAGVADLVGTNGIAFWLSADSSFGNDSGGGGQLCAPGDVVCS